MANRKKKCKQCGEIFNSFNSLQKVCSPTCAIKYGKNQERLKKEKEFDKETRKLKKQLREKDRSWWLKEAQKEFNKWIRWRDRSLPCISCGKSTGCKVNAGHYKPAGNNSLLRFNELNVHKQCEHCNCHKSGNLTTYRERLIDKIGIRKVEWLEGCHELKKWTIDELREIRDEYRKRNKEVD